MQALLEAGAVQVCGMHAKARLSWLHRLEEAGEAWEGAVACGGGAPVAPAKTEERQT